jgi:hypothetical protein
MQVGIPVAYNVCEVKLDKMNHRVRVHREDFLVKVKQSRYRPGLAHRVPGS